MQLFKKIAFISRESISKIEIVSAKYFRPSASKFRAMHKKKIKGGFFQEW
jgi:hypothetical protein